MSQMNNVGILHSVAYFSRKHFPAECNYKIYDKELLAVIRSAEKWRPHLEFMSHRIQVLSDHRNLEYVMITKLLIRPHAGW